MTGIEQYQYHIVFIVGVIIGFLIMFAFNYELKKQIKELKKQADYEERCWLFTGEG